VALKTSAARDVAEDCGIEVDDDAAGGEGMGLGQEKLDLSRASRRDGRAGEAGDQAGLRSVCSQWGCYQEREQEGVDRNATDSVANRDPRGGAWALRLHSL
jgi:hypothetical protein